MPLYVATAFFECNSHGWSESYYRDSGGTTDLAAIADFDRGAIWTKRALACGKQVTITEQRVSFANVLGDSILNYIPLGGNQAFDSEDPNTALLVRWGISDNTKTKFTYLRGIDDATVFEGGKFNRAVGVFVGALNDFRDAIIFNNYGWLGTDVKTNMAVNGYSVVPATNQLDFDIGTNFPPGVVGDKLTVRGKGFGAGNKSVLNTSFVVTIQANSTLRTLKPTAAFPFAGDGPVLIRRTKALRVITSCRYQKVVERKAGKASFISRGRLPVRPRG